MRFVLLTLVFALSACTSAPKHYSSNPLSAYRDDMEKTITVKSNRIEYHGEIEFNSKHGGDYSFFKPYLLDSNNKAYLRATVRSFSSDPIYYSKISIMCDSKDPIHVEQKPLELWSKTFDTRVGPHAAYMVETSDIQIDAKHRDYILKCQDELRVRLSGQAQYVEFRYNRSEKPQYFEGLSDLDEFLTGAENSEKKQSQLTN